MDGVQVSVLHVLFQMNSQDMPDDVRAFNLSISCKISRNYVAWPRSLGSRQNMVQMLGLPSYVNSNPAEHISELDQFCPILNVFDLIIIVILPQLCWITQFIVEAHIHRPSAQAACANESFIQGKGNADRGPCDWVWLYFHEGWFLRISVS